MFKILLVVLLWLFSGVCMANENKYDSAYTMISVAHPDGIHNIAVPEDTPLADFHNALLENYTHPAIEVHIKQPTREDSLEYSEPFRKAAANAVSLARQKEFGRLHGSSDSTGEAGFVVGKNGEASEVKFSPDRTGADHAGMTLGVRDSDIGTFHTHDSFHQADPSAVDIDSAKKFHKTVYIASRSGLYAIDPGGQLTQIFKNPDWASSKNPK
jgi:hypothetical protein